MDPMEYSFSDPLPVCCSTPVVGRRQELANLRGALLRDLRVEKLVPLRKELEKWREEVNEWE